MCILKRTGTKKCDFGCTHCIKNWNEKSESATETTPTQTKKRLPSQYDRCLNNVHCGYSSHSLLFDCYLSWCYLNYYLLCWWWLWLLCLVFGLALTCDNLTFIRFFFSIFLQKKRLLIWRKLINISRA